VRDIAFTPDGAQLVIGGEFGVVARAFPGGAVVQSPDWSQFAATYNGVIVSSDGAHLVTAEESGSVHLWSTATWQITSEVAQATVRAQDVALSSDGALVAVAGAQGAGEVYRTATGAIVRGLGYSEDSHSVIFSPDNALLAIGTETGELGIVNTADWSDARRITGVHSSTVADLAFSLDHQLIASTGDERVTVWQTTGSAPRNDLFVGPSDFIGRTVAISPDGARLVAGGSDGEVRIWTVPALAALPALPGHGPGVVKARFSPDGQSLAVAYDDGTVWLWCRP
jgi:WD40 repeat protein